MGAMGKLRFYLGREWLSLALGAVLTLLLVDFVAGPLGPRDLLALRAHQSHLVHERDHLLAENAALRERIGKLRSNDAYLERLIRHELGYARSDELVYRFSSDKSSHAP
jgi:cell division protein FtsB